MINWWREDLYLDWLEITTITILAGLVIVCIVYDIVIERKKERKKKQENR